MISRARSSARSLLDLADAPVGDIAHLLLDLLEQDAFGLLLRQARDAGELGLLLFLQASDLAALGLELLLFLSKAAVAGVHLLDLGVELLVLLVQAGLVPLELSAAFPVLGLGGLGDTEGLVFRLEDDLLLLRASLGDQAVGVCAGSLLAREREVTTDKESNGEADETRGEGHKAHDEDVGHFEGPFLVRRAKARHAVGARTRPTR